MPGGGFVYGVTDSGVALHVPPPAVAGSFTLKHRGLAGLRAFSIPAYAGECCFDR